MVKKKKKKLPLKISYFQLSFGFKRFLRISFLFNLIIFFYYELETLMVYKFTLNLVICFPVSSELLPWESF